MKLTWVVRTAILLFAVLLTCIGLFAMEETTTPSGVGEPPSHSSCDKPKSKSKSKKSKSLVADGPIKPTTVIRDPVTGKFRSANCSGSDSVSLADKTPHKSVSPIDSNVDVISIDKRDISQLSNVNLLSADLFQSETFQATLLQAVQRAQLTTARKLNATSSPDALGPTTLGISVLDAGETAGVCVPPPEMSWSHSTPVMGEAGDGRFPPPA